MVKMEGGELEAASLRMAGSTTDDPAVVPEDQVGIDVGVSWL